MSWTWRYEGEDGSVVAVDGANGSESFTSQGDAETWLGEEWRTLLDRGVSQVSLLESGDRVYGPMSLRPVT